MVRDDHRAPTNEVKQRVPGSRGESRKENNPARRGVASCPFLPGLLEMEEETITASPRKFHQQSAQS